MQTFKDDFDQAYTEGTLFLVRKLEEDVAYRVLVAGNFPAHRTIAAPAKRDDL